MIGFKNIEGLYFVGIGGIGMSALALYFAKGGYTIAGYDRSESRITRSLTENGCSISYKDEVGNLPDLFRNSSAKNMEHSPSRMKCKVVLAGQASGSRSSISD